MMLRSSSGHRPPFPEPDGSELKSSVLQVTTPPQMSRPIFERSARTPPQSELTRQTPRAPRIRPQLMEGPSKVHAHAPPDLLCKDLWVRSLSMRNSKGPHTLLHRPFLRIQR